MAQQRITIYGRITKPNALSSSPKSSPPLQATDQAQGTKRKASFSSVPSSPPPCQQPPKKQRCIEPLTSESSPESARKTPSQKITGHILEPLDQDISSTNGHCHSEQPHTTAPNRSSSPPTRLSKGQLRLLDLKPPPPPSRTTISVHTAKPASFRAQSLLARLKAKQSSSAGSSPSSSAAPTGLGAQRAEEIKRVLLSMAAAQRGGRKAFRVGSVVEAVKDSKVGGSLSDREVRQGIEVLIGEGFLREVGGGGVGAGKFLMLC